MSCCKNTRRRRLDCLTNFPYWPMATVPSASSSRQLLNTGADEAKQAVAQQTRHDQRRPLACGGRSPWPASETCHNLPTAQPPDANVSLYRRRTFSAGWSRGRAGARLRHDALVVRQLKEFAIMKTLLTDQLREK